MSGEKTTPGHGLRTLVVVDDCEQSLELYKIVAERCGFNLCSFNDVLKALDFIRDYQVDVVITDYRMPLMNGLVFAREVRKYAERVRIIMITSDYDNSDLQKGAFNSGISCLLSKPLNVEALTGRLMD
jgi:DNA-binding response OmpR family regulator